MSRPLRELLANASFDLSSEPATQDGIARALTDAGVDFKREVRLTPTDQIDFLIGDRGMEVKLRGSRSALLRQLHRYAEHDRIGSLTLVTSSPRLAALPEVLRGKSVDVIILSGSLF